MTKPKRIKYIKFGPVLFAKVSGEWYKSIISDDKIIYLIGGKRVARPEKKEG
tara:strand:+ start:13144 stop:13299 length:156 start_codon:yes stop_codon:yes gene_type:complete